MANDYEVLVGVEVNDSKLDNLEKRINDIKDKKVTFNVDVKGSLETKLSNIEKSLGGISKVAGVTKDNIKQIDSSNMKTLLSSLNQIADALGAVNKEGQSNTVLSNFDAISASISNATEEIKEFIAAYGSMSSLGNIDLSGLLSEENIAQLANAMNGLNISGGNNTARGAKKAAENAVETAVENTVEDIAERAFGNVASKQMTVPIPSGSAKKISLRGRSTLLGDTVTTKKSGLREATIAIDDGAKTAMVDAASSWLDDVGGLISTNIEDLTRKQRRELAGKLSDAKAQIADVTRSLGQDDVDKQIEDISKQRQSVGSEQSRIRSARSRERDEREREYLQQDLEKQQRLEDELLAKEIRMRQLDLAKRHNTIRENVSAIRTNDGDMSRAQYEMLSSIVPPSVVPNVNRINYVKQGIRPSYSIGATGLELIEYYKDPMIESLSNMFLRGDKDTFNAALYNVASMVSSSKNKSKGQKEFADFIEDIVKARKKGISNQEEYDYTGYTTEDFIDEIVVNKILEGGNEDIRTGVANRVSRMIIEGVQNEDIRTMRMLGNNGITLKDIFKNIPQSVIDREDARIRRRNTPSTIAEDVVFDAVGNTPEFSNAQELAYNAMYTLAGFRGMIKDGKFVGVSKNKGGDIITSSYRVPTTSEFATSLKHFFWNTTLGAKGDEREIGTDFIRRVEQAEMRGDKNDPVYSELYQYMVNNERRIVGEKRLSSNNVLRNRRFPDEQRLSQSKLGVQKLSDERLERIRNLESVFNSGILDEAELPSVDVGVPKDNLRNRFQNLVKTIAYQSGMVAANEDYSFDKYFKEFFSDVEGILLDDTGRVATSFNDILDSDGKKNFDKEQASVLYNVNRLNKQGWAANHTIYGQLIERGLNIARDMGIDVSEFDAMPTIFAQDVTPEQRTTIGQRLEQLNDEELAALEEKAARINAEKAAEKEAKDNAAIDKHKAQTLREKQISEYKQQIGPIGTIADNDNVLRVLFNNLNRETGVNDDSLIRNSLRYASGPKTEIHKNLSRAMRGDEEAYQNLVKSVLDGAAKEGIDTSSFEKFFAEQQENKKKKAELEQKIEEIRSLSDDEILGRATSSDTSGQDKKVEIETNAQEVASDAQQMQSSIDEVKSSANAAGDAASEAGDKINNSFDSSKPVSDLQAIVNAINEVVVAIRELSTIDIGNMFSAYANAGGDVEELAKAMGVFKNAAKNAEGKIVDVADESYVYDENGYTVHSRLDVRGNEKIKPVREAVLTYDEVSKIVGNDPEKSAIPENISGVFQSAIKYKEKAAKLKAEDPIGNAMEIETLERQYEDAIDESVRLLQKYRADVISKIANAEKEVAEIEAELEKTDGKIKAAKNLDKDTKDLEKEKKALEKRLKEQKKISEDSAFEKDQLETHLQNVLSGSNRTLEVFDAKYKSKVVDSLEEDYERLGELERKKSATDKTDSKTREKIEKERKALLDKIEATERSVGIDKEKGEYGLLGEEHVKRYVEASSEKRIEEARQLGERDKALREIIEDTKLISDNEVKMAGLDKGSEAYKTLKQKNYNASRRIKRRKEGYDFTKEQNLEIEAAEQESLSRVNYADDVAYDKKREKALTKRLAIEEKIAKYQADMAKQEEGTPLYEDAKKNLELAKASRDGYDNLYKWTPEQQKRISEEVAKAGSKVDTAQAKKDQDEIKNNFKELLDIEKEINSTQIKLDDAIDRKDVDLIEKYINKLNELKDTREKLKSGFGISEESPRGTLTDSQYKEYSSTLRDLDIKTAEAASNRTKSKNAEEAKQVSAELKELESNVRRLNQLKLDMVGLDKSSDKFKELGKAASETFLKIKAGEKSLEGRLSEEQMASYSDLQHRLKQDYDIATSDGMTKEGQLKELIKLQKEAYRLRKQRVGKQDTAEVVNIEKQLDAKKQQIAEIENKLGLKDVDISKAINDPNLLMTMSRGKLSEEQFHSYASAVYEAALSLETLERKYEDTQRTLKQKVVTGRESFLASLELWKHENSRAANMSKYSSQLLGFKDKAEALVGAGDVDALKRLNEEFSIFKKNVAAAGDTGMSIGDKLKIKFREYAAYAATSMGVMEVVQGLKQMAQEVLTVDTAMTELKRVTDLTADGYDKLYDKMSKAANKNGQVLSDTINATADWVRAGFDAETSVLLADKTAMYQNVSDLGYDEAAENLLTSYNGFKEDFLKNYGGDEAAAVEHIVDVLNELDNNFSVTSAGLGEGLARSASALQMAGNTFEQSAAMIGAVAEVTQDPEKAGNAMKILSLRLRGMKGELEELGEEVDDNVENISKMQGQILKFTHGKVNIFNDAGEFKSTYDIMMDIASVYDQLSSTEQADLLETIAGKHRANDVAALIQNIGNAAAMEQSAMNSAGSATTENAKYVESLQGRINKLTTSWQQLSNVVMSSDLLKGLVSGLSGIVDLLTGIVDTFGTIPSLVGLIGGALTFTGFKELAPFNVVEKEENISGKGIDFTWADRIKSIKNIEKFSFSDEFESTLKNDTNALNDFVNALSKGRANGEAWRKVSDECSESAVRVGESLKHAYNTIVEESGEEAAQNAVGLLTANLDDLEGLTDEQINRRKEFIANATEEQKKNAELLYDIYNEKDYNKKRRLSGLQERFNDKSFKNVKQMIDLSKDTEALKKYGLTQEQFAEQAKKSGTFLGKYISQGAGVANQSLGRYIVSLGASKVAMFATQAAAMAMNAAMTFGISALLGGIVALGSYLQEKYLPTASQVAEKTQEIMEKFNEKNDAAKKAKKTVQEVGSAYAELSKGVNQVTGENVSLSSDEYEEYLNVTNQIADAIPSLVKGFDEQGNAILSCAGDVGALTEAYKEMQIEANNALLKDADTVFKDFENKSKKVEGKKLFDFSNDIDRSSYEALKKIEDGKSLTEQYNEAMQSYNDAQLYGLDTYNTIANMEASKIGDSANEIAKALKGYGYDKEGLFESNEDFIKRILKDNPRVAVKISKGFEDSLEPLAEDMRSVVEAKFSNAFLEGDYDNISDSMQTMISSMIPNLSYDFFLDFFDDSGNFDAVKFYGELNGILDTFNSMPSAKSKSFEVFADIQTKYNNGDITVNEYLSEVQKIESVIGTLDPEVQKSVKLVLGIDENTVQVDKDALKSKLMEEELGMQEDIAEEFVGNLTSGELKIALDLVTEGKIDNGMIKEYEEIIDEMKSKGLEIEDLSRRYFGNIDTDNRQVIEWTKKNLEANKEALMSWQTGDNAKSWEQVQKDMKNSYSTIMGTWGTFGYGDKKDKKEIAIAFSPMLQTESGAELLSQDTVDKYIGKLISQATEDNGFLNTNKLLSLDMTGIEVDGKKIKGLIGAIGEEASKVAEIMHYYGKEGAVNGTELMQNLQRELEVQEALNYTINIDAETAGLESLNTALQESRSGAGLSSESIQALKSRYSELESAGYDLSKMLDLTSNGVSVNTHEINKLERAYNKQRFEETSDTLKTLTDEYERLNGVISDSSVSSKEKADARTRQGNLLNQIHNVSVLASQYEGLASAYRAWKNAEDSGSERDMYNEVGSGLKDIKEELDDGWFDEGTQKYFELIWGEAEYENNKLVRGWETAGKSMDDYRKKWKTLDSDISGTNYSIKDFFKTDDDGNLTSSGIWNFYKAVRQKQEQLKRDGKFEGEDWIKTDKNGNMISFDFGVDGAQAVADALGISEELVQIFERASRDCGFVVDLTGGYTSFAELESRAQEAVDRIKEDFDGLEININASTDEEIGESYTNAIQHLAKFQNADGTINEKYIKKNGKYTQQAQDAVDAANYMLAVKQELEDPTYMTLDTSDVEASMQEPLELLQQYRQTAKQIESAELLGDTKTAEDLNKQVDDIVQKLQKLDDEQKLTLGISDKTDEQIKEMLLGNEINIEGTLALQVEMSESLEDIVMLMKNERGLISDEELKSHFNHEDNSDYIDKTMSSADADTKAKAIKFLDVMSEDDSFDINSYDNNKQKRIVTFGSKWSDADDYDNNERKIILDIIDDVKGIENYTSKQANRVADFANDNANLLDGFSDAQRKNVFDLIKNSNAALTYTDTEQARVANFARNVDGGVDDLSKDQRNVVVKFVRDVEDIETYEPEEKRAIVDFVKDTKNIDSYSPDDKKAIVKFALDSTAVEDYSIEEKQAVVKFVADNKDIESNITDEQKETVVKFVKDTAEVDGWTPELETALLNIGYNEDDIQKIKDEVGTVEFDSEIKDPEQKTVEGGTANYTGVLTTPPYLPVEEGGQANYTGFLTYGPYLPIAEGGQANYAGQLVTYPELVPVGTGDANYKSKISQSGIPSVINNAGIAFYNFGVKGATKANGTAYVGGSAFSEGTFGTTGYNNKKENNEYVEVVKTGKTIVSSNDKLTKIEDNDKKVVDGSAFAQGSWGTKDSGVALGGELGQELVVRDGRWFTIGDNGAEFFKYKKNDIIFNAGQTKQLFEQGKVVNGRTRGMLANANGTAFASGNAFAFGRAFADKGTIPTEPSGNDYGNGGGSNKNKSSSDDDKKVDWIERAIKRLERAISKLDTTIDNIGKSWTTRNKNIDEKILRVKEKRDIEAKGEKRYMKEAKNVGLQEKYAKKVRNGTIDIEKIENEDLRKKIEEYQKWYDKAQDCRQAVEDLNAEIVKLKKQKFDNIVSKYDYKLSRNEHRRNLLDERMTQQETAGYVVSELYYAEDKKRQQNYINYIDKEIPELEAVMATVKDKNSEAYQEMQKQLWQLEEDRAKAVTAIIEDNNKIRQSAWDIFDMIQDRISQITQESDFLIDLMSIDKLYEDNGQLNDKGMATLGLRGVNYNTYMEQAARYKEELKSLNAELEKDPYNQTLVNRRNEVLQAQQDAIKSAKDEKEAIKSLVEEGIDKELDALQKLIDKKKDALDSQKDLYDYQRKVKDQTKEIAKLEKQMAAYAGDDSEEAKAKLQELKVSLEDAREDLQDTEYDKYVSDQQEMLDDLYDKYEEILNKRLDNVDALIGDMIEKINDGAGEIKSTIKGSAESVGYELTDEMKRIWESPGNPVANYAQGVINSINGESGVKKSVDGIAADVNKMIGAINNDAAKDIKSPIYNTDKLPNTKVETDPVTTNPPTTQPKTTKPKTTTTTTTTTTRKPKVGQQVTYASGKYYSTSDGKGPSGSQNKGKKVYVTNINKSGSYPYHISTGKKLGSGDLGWVRLNQLSGYATGKRKLLSDEFALTQENGAEMIVRPSDGAILTPLAKGDSVLNATATGNIWDMANSPADFIRDNLNVDAVNPNASGNAGGNYTQNFENISFVLPNVKNYDQMLAAMQKDKNFERLINAMTVDQIAGKSSLGKGKAIR